MLLDVTTRFWAKVRRGPDCWEWTGALTTGRWQYGKLNVDGATVRAHRLSWTLHYGPVPAGFCVLHRCDNPRCVRPEHLWLGTLSDNSRDMVSKARQGLAKSHGSRHHAAKLTEVQVSEIRQRYAAGETNKAALAREYRVTDVLIGHIVRREGWRHLP